MFIHNFELAIIKLEIEQRVTITPIYTIRTFVSLLNICEHMRHKHTDDIVQISRVQLSLDITAAPLGGYSERVGRQMILRLFGWRQTEQLNNSACLPVWVAILCTIWRKGKAF